MLYISCQLVNFRDMRFFRNRVNIKQLEYSKYTVKGRGAQIWVFYGGAKLFAGPQYGTCFISLDWTSKILK
jgi:hypothetical protein